MLKRALLSVSFVALAMTTGMGLAQTQEAPTSTEPAKFYRLEFVVKEVEGGKVLNTRSYSMMTEATGAIYRIRAGSKVPVATGPSVQYLDVGVNIDFRAIREVQRDLALSVSAEISSIPSESGEVKPNPIVRQNKWDSSVVVPLKKPTLIFSSDDVSSKRTMQLELTATPIAPM